MDRDLIIETTCNRINEILKYCDLLTEAGEDMGVAPEQPAGPEQPEMGGPMPEGGPMPDGDAGAMPPQEGEMMPDAGVEGFAPEGAEPMPDGAEPMPDGGAEDVEEIDVDDLTDAQEDTEKHVKHLNKKIDGLDEKFSKLMDFIDRFEGDINSANQKIEDLKQEFEKRNPTNVEKMTLRSKQAYPSGETPEEYWKKKEAEGVYSTEEGTGGESEKYQITKTDVDKINNWNDIYDSIDKGAYRQSLSSVLGY